MTLSVSLSHRFPDFALDLSFDAPEGITVLFGRSGSGKTTAINSVAGLLKPQRARIVMGDETLNDTDSQIFVPVHKRRMGYVFQEARLFPHLSVRQNLEYGQRFAPSGAKGPSTAEVAALLGIAPLLDRVPSGLSGGERQRVAIGRALLSRPRLLLMDEPLAALDGARKAEILPYLERLRDQVALPILYVSHSVAEVARLATTMVVLEEGRVARAGPAEAILSDPDMVRQIGVREAGAVLPARVKRHHPDGLTELEASGGRLFLPRMETEEGTATRVRILAQDVILSNTAPEGLSALNILKATVISLREGTGPGVVVQLSAGEDKLLARITRRSAEALAITPGDTVYAVVKSVSIARVDIGTA
ncbi:molybdenum ABC transporter ATP-binding protein [Aestuariivita boseongensis]|uniref:molybdenum ABC transporter ATP-binding protein n=1 Tax=Aestuariivita boseongensis TaxID=1470562 RepID=UPI000682D273|nr:molybdenum ABC transporter ATP-binding protein [Aestuariivita boseongensis]